MLLLPLQLVQNFAAKKRVFARALFMRSWVGAEGFKPRFMLRLGPAPPPDWCAAILCDSLVIVHLELTPMLVRCSLVYADFRRRVADQGAAVSSARRKGGYAR